MVAQCKALQTSFLDQQRQPSSSSTGLLRNNTNLINPSSYNAALDHVLRDTVAPLSSRVNEPNAVALSMRVSELSSYNPQTPAQGVGRDDRERFIGALHSLSAQYFRALAIAPQYLTVEQLDEIEREIQGVVYIIRNYQQHSSQSNQTPALLYPIPVITQSPTQQADATYITSVQYQPSPTASNEFYGLMGMSTQPSSQGFDTASSQYRMSAHTGASSMYDTTNQALLSPFPTPNGYRRASVSSQPTPEIPRRYHEVSSPRSLRNGYAQGNHHQANLISPTIDPALLNTPQSDNGEELNYIQRQFWPDG